MHIYFIGIGGSGLSPLAQLALDCGYDVSGSDIAESHGTRAVENRGVVVSYNQDGSSLEAIHNNKKVDWVIYTAACKDDHAEILFAKQHSIKTSKRDRFLNFVLDEKNLKLIAVAGTHGKTTTTGMLVWVFKELGIPVSYLIGSNIGFGPSAAYQQDSEYFVLEADEFDRNFLHFTPEYSLITNIDFDHKDIYKDKRDYNEAFAQFTTQTKKSVYLWDEDYTKIQDLVDQDSIYNYNSDTVLTKNTLNSIKLKGEHNRKNAFLAYEVLKEIFSIDSTNELSTFPGTQRRMEELIHNVYTDYAHHPTEIKSTIQLISEISKEIVIVYQPHQNVRQHEVQDMYLDCFDGAQKVYWLPTYLSREDPNLEILTPEFLISKIPNNSHIEHAEMTIDLKAHIQEALNQGKIVVGMGAGDIDSWLRAITKDLQVPTLVK